LTYGKQQTIYFVVETKGDFNDINLTIQEICNRRGCNYMDTTKERASIVEIYNNGAMIDALEDSLLSATKLTESIVEQINTIDDYFNNPL